MCSAPPQFVPTATAASTRLSGNVSRLPWSHLPTHPHRPSPPALSFTRNIHLRCFLPHSPNSYGVHLQFDLLLSTEFYPTFSCLGFLLLCACPNQYGHHLRALGGFYAFLIQTRFLEPGRTTNSSFVVSSFSTGGLPCAHTSTEIPSPAVADSNRHDRLNSGFRVGCLAASITTCRATNLRCAGHITDPQLGFNSSITPRHNPHDITYH